MTTPSELVTATANRWDGSGLLAEQALQRLAWRRARSGKACSKCEEAKPLSAFGRDSRERDGLNRVCGSCKSAVNAAAYARKQAI
jgi:hypothetical protein